MQERFSFLFFLSLPSRRDVSIIFLVSLILKLWFGGEVKWLIANSEMCFFAFIQSLSAYIFLLSASTNSMLPSHQTTTKVCLKWQQLAILTVYVWQLQVQILEFRICYKIDLCSTLLNSQQFAMQDLVSIIISTLKFFNVNIS